MLAYGTSPYPCSIRAPPYDRRCDGLECTRLAHAWASQWSSARQPIQPPCTLDERADQLLVNMTMRAQSGGSGNSCRGATRRLLLVVAATLLAGEIAQAGELQWDRLREGLSASVWAPGAACHDDIPPVFLVRVDPERFRFATYHYADERLRAPVLIQDWHTRTGAMVLFNAGLFDEGYSYLGLLIKDGRLLGSRRHPTWHGLFVAEPVVPGLRQARVVDLAMETFPLEPPAYREAAQSLMLLDRRRIPRVQRTGKRAHQLVLGEEEDGHILLMKTSSAVPLWELADCLRRMMPHVRQAMAMDGGASADLFIASSLVDRSGQGGVLPAWDVLVDGKGLGHIALPAVIGILPRETGSALPAGEAGPAE